MKQVLNRAALSVQISGEPDTGDFLAAYICIVPGQVERTREVIEGLAFADYDADGKLLGIELLDYCDPELLADLVKDESEIVRSFIRWATPNQMTPVLSLDTGNAL